MNNLIVSASPHIHNRTDTQRIMLDVLIAMCPMIIASVILFGWRSLLVIGVCVATCLIGEWGFEKIVKRPSTISDLSACVTGVILALNMPVTTPLWHVAFGVIVAIVVVKQMFGGIGKNFANPAITARVVMLIAFAGSMTTWIQPISDALSSATPLALIKMGAPERLPSLGDMFLGYRSGSLGETCTLAILLGGIYLLIRRVITWHIPVSFIGTVFIITAIMGKQPVYQLMSGGLMLAAFFMATDYVTSPATVKGKIIFGIGCGLITSLIRIWGNYPEGVSFAVLLMNICTPHINNLTRTKPLGGVNP